MTKILIHQETLLGLAVLRSAPMWLEKCLTAVFKAILHSIYIYIYNEGPRPRSQKCLFLRPQKQACWKFPCALIIICDQHSYHECRHTHTHREGPWMQGMVSCKKKPPFLDLLRSMSAQHCETYKATFTVSGPWLRMWQWNSDEYSWH